MILCVITHLKGVKCFLGHPVLISALTKLPDFSGRTKSNYDFLIFLRMRTTVLKLTKIYVALNADSKTLHMAHHILPEKL